MKAAVFISGFFLLMAMFSCKPGNDFEFSPEKLNNIPDSLLQPEQMIEVLTNIHLAEAWAVEMKNDTVSKDIRLQQFYGEIFSKYNTTTEQYKASYNYYASDPPLMHYIYQKVTEKLNLLESKTRNIKNTTQENEQSNQ